MQRLKAVQTDTVEGNWRLAQHVEFIPTSCSHLASTSEVRAAQHTQVAQLKLSQGGKGGAAKGLGMTSAGLGHAEGKAPPSSRRPPSGSDASVESHRNLGAPIDGANCACSAKPPTGEPLQLWRYFLLQRILGPRHRQPRLLVCSTQLSEEHPVLLGSRSPCVFRAHTKVPPKRARFNGPVADPPLKAPDSGMDESKGRRGTGPCL